MGLPVTGGAPQLDSDSDESDRAPVHDGAVVTPREDTPGLTPEEELRLQQLLQTRAWHERSTAAHSEPMQAGNERREDSSPPERWQLTIGLSLHDWQSACVDAWFANGKRGVLKVVTGAGKTILALAIAERLQQREVKDLCLAIVVPTLVLAAQWREELRSRSNIPSSAIGMLGAGSHDGFGGGVCVLVCVLASASKKLAAEIDRAGVGERLLLVVDECHRAGAREMQHLFQSRRAFSLGLSATPERDDSGDEEPDGGDASDLGPAPSFDDSVVGRELGNVIFELNYAEAISRGILPPFRIVHYGLSLKPPEQQAYERISRQIRDLRSELETGKRRGLALMRWARSRAGSDSRAARLISLSSERKQLLFRMADRRAAVLRVLRESFDRNPDTKAILFHENIHEVMRLFTELREAGFAVVAEHSEFSDTLRAESIRLFRAGIARVIVSVRSLIEGFNVPAADVGIVVAASSSVRQRVQTLGRLLRRSEREDGREKAATLFVLYASETVDEFIYEKANWDEFVGASRNDYFAWSDVEHSQPEPREGPPRSARTPESAIKPTELTPGGEYPGDPHEGTLYSLDTQGTVSDEEGRPIEPHEQLREVISRMPRGGGRFRVTPVNRFVVRLEKTPEGWRTMYMGRLDSDLQPAPRSGAIGAEDLTPGVSYPLGLAHGKVYSLLRRDRRLIAEKRPGLGIRFVVPLDQIADETKRRTLAGLQTFLAGLPARGHRPNKITVTSMGHVVYLFENQAYFAGFAPEGAEGFMFEGA